MLFILFLQFSHLNVFQVHIRLLAQVQSEHLILYLVLFSGSRKVIDERDDVNVLRSNPVASNQY